MEAQKLLLVTCIMVSYYVSVKFSLLFFDSIHLLHGVCCYRFGGSHAAREFDTRHTILRSQVTK